MHILMDQPIMTVRLMATLDIKQCTARSILLYMAGSDITQGAQYIGQGRGNGADYTGMI